MKKPNKPGSVVMILSDVSIEQHLSSLSANGCSPHTMRAYRGDLKGLQTWLKTSGVEPQTWEDLERAAAEYFSLHKTTWSPRTSRRRVTGVKGWAKAHGQRDFLEEFRPAVAARSQPRPLDAGFKGVLRLIAYAPRTKDRTIFALCGFCGLRVYESVGIFREDVDLKARTIRVWGKGAKERVVPISDRALPYLVLACQDTLPGQQLVPMTADNARKIIRKCGEDAGITVASHDLRATFATEVYKATHDIAAVQELLGHTNVDTTRLYIHLNRTRLHTAVNCHI